MRLRESLNFRYSPCFSMENFGFSTVLENLRHASDCSPRFLTFFNRRAAAGDLVVGFGFLFLLFFVAVGFVGGVLVFFGGGIDFRGIESAQLAAHLKECIRSHSLKLGTEISLEQLSRDCHLQKQVILSAYVLSLFKNDVQVLNVGDTIACDFKGAEKNIYYPRCREEQFTFEKVKYTIRVGSHQVTQLEIA